MCIATSTPFWLPIHKCSGVSKPPPHSLGVGVAANPTPVSFRTSLASLVCRRWSLLITILKGVSDSTELKELRPNDPSQVRPACVP